MNLDELLSMNADDLTPSDEGDSALLERNLAALAFRSPREAQRIREAHPRGDIEFIETDEGMSATLGGVALASKRRPISEANKLAGSIDPEANAIVAIIGFALGHHCGAILDRLGEWGLVVCYEPDVALLRSVLSRVDCSALLRTGQFFLVCDPSEHMRCNEIFTGNEALIGMGVELMKHPPSSTRLASSSDQFSQTLTTALRASRTHVVTTLANARTTFRNSIMNLDHYLRTAGVKELEGSCAGKPAIVVSAGPSLEKNIDLLCDPKMRERFVIIAVQTVLKPLLAKGIKPHFVTALDYHEISGRFYEGLSEEDVRGVRLVAEPKGNPIILDSFPGEVLCPQDSTLDLLLNDGRDRGQLSAAATVAHLCYNLARYLGCDPVILIGQDLGFSDGQYYADGAAIHHVWASELSSHRTLEMFEWERIVRGRAHLIKREDIYGGTIYSDEQMNSYLSMFEQMFQEDSNAGLTVIDATEGGVRKEHTQVMTLKQAIDKFSGEPIELPSGSTQGATEAVHQDVYDRLSDVIEDAKFIERVSKRSIDILGEMLRKQSDQQRVSKLIEKINAGRDEVMQREDVFKLVEFVNQVAVLNRLKRDRVIRLREKEADAQSRQRLQIERDVKNVEWTRDAARSIADQVEHVVDVLKGEAPKQYAADVDEHEEAGLEGAMPKRSRELIHAVVVVDPKIGGLGQRRDLNACVMPDSTGGHNILQATLARLDSCTQINGITLVTTDQFSLNSLLDGFTTKSALDVVEVDTHELRSHRDRIGGARAQSATSWRGSLGMQSVFDEVISPKLLAQVMTQQGIDGAAIVGADWSMIDPLLVDSIVERFRSLESEKRVAFSQACPGLGTMVIDRESVSTLSESTTLNGRRNHFSTFGALLSYIPTAPQADPIVRGVCVQIEPELRDAGVRAIADSIERASQIRDAYASLSEPLTANATACAQSLRATTRVTHPRTLVLETCTGRLVGGLWGMWKRGSRDSVERLPIELSAAHGLLREHGAAREDACVIFDGAGDPLMHHQAMELVSLAKEDGVLNVELRTDLVREGIGVQELIESGVDLLSVDVIGDSREVYEQLAGVDMFDQVCDRLQSIYDETADSSLWLAARLTRCEQTLEQIESFYDKWLLLTGCAMIDPLPSYVRGQRISGFHVPKWRSKQMEREIMRLRCDGIVIDAAGHAIMSQGTEINAINEGIERAYQRMRSAVRASALELKPNAEEYAA